MKLLKLLPILILVITSCGGSGGEKKKFAIITLETIGTPSKQLSGIGVTIQLPSGIVPTLKGDNTPDESKFDVSNGVASPATVLTPVIYTPASGTTQGTLRLVVASTHSGGFGAGKYATVTLDIKGNEPKETDFVLTNFNPVDILGGTASGLSPKPTLTLQ